MGKYRIKVEYRTGNSFETHIEDGFIDLEWNDFEMAKESLRRIKNHNEYIKEYNHWTEPEEQIDGVYWSKDKCIGLEIITDDGNNYKMSAFWTGYFETLIKAEIVCNDDDTVYIP